MLGLFYNASLVFEAYEIQSALHEIKCQVIFKVMDSDVAKLLRRTVIPSSFFILALAQNFFSLQCSAITKCPNKNKQSTLWQFTIALEYLVVDLAQVLRLLLFGQISVVDFTSENRGDNK